jgi:uncharacterized protein (TIGR03066 family)
MAAGLLDFQIVLCHAGVITRSQRKNMNRIAFAMIALATLAHFQLQAEPIKKPKEKTTVEKVVGKWKLTKANGTETNDVFVEFDKDGKMTISMGAGDCIQKYSGKYTVGKDESIDYEVSIGDAKKSEILKIKKLTEEEMKTEDPDGVLEEFERVKEKKDN